MEIEIIQDKHQFLKQVHDYRSELLKVAQSRLHDSNLAEDAVSESILKAVDRRTQLRDTNRLFSWLARIVSNHCYDLLRKQKKEIITEMHESFDSGSNSSKNQANHKFELISSIEAILDAILAIRPREHRKLLMQFYYHKMNYDRIAMHESIPVGTVKSRLNRARESLQKELHNRNINETDLEKIQDLSQWPDIMFEYE